MKSDWMLIVLSVIVGIVLILIVVFPRNNVNIKYKEKIYNVVENKAIVNECRCKCKEIKDNEEI